MSRQFDYLLVHGCRSIFGKKSEYVMKRLSDSDESDSDERAPAKQARLSDEAASTSAERNTAVTATQSVVSAVASSTSSSGTSSPGPSSSATQSSNASSSQAMSEAVTTKVNSIDKEQQKKNLLKNSFGPSAVKKSSKLGLLVKKKDSQQSHVTGANGAPSLYETVKRQAAERAAQKAAKVKQETENGGAEEKPSTASQHDVTSPAVSVKADVKPVGLSLLSGYSDSEDSTGSDS